MDDMRLRENAELKKLDEACLAVPNGTKIGFILPSEGRGVNTTQFCIHVRHGTLFHLCIMFKTENELRNELSSFQFSASDHVEDLDPDGSEAKLQAELQRVRTIQHLVSSKCPISGQN